MSTKQSVQNIFTAITKFLLSKKYGYIHIVLKRVQILSTQIGFEPKYICHPGIEPKPFYIFQAIWQYAYRLEAF